ncbi:hypothetical protein H0H81_000241 [Sphagnurus paluster]|uniref:Phosphoglycerate mutase-like protein n=1 Tax=Sphagnurus paluster TaxID=117069 RepID=A0A9P7GV31_9AGAR|nr:hypothetical protein H0H81_000241 [Sphagnurus paluster]
MFIRLSIPFVLGAVVLAGAFDPLQHAGPASPYFDAPSQIPSSTPPNCKVDQAAYILRHGARYPEPGSFGGWQNLHAKLQNATYTARGPLAFIRSWSPPVDDAPHQPLYLTSTGAGEAFALGVDLRKRYGFTKGGDNFTVWAASQQRCVDTSTYFLRGYLSQGNYLATPELNRGRSILLADSVSYTHANSLTPSAACPAYASGSTGSAKANAYRATYQARVAQRLNTFLDGLTLDAGDIGPMQDLCGFQAGINGDTRFCDIFEESEWLDYEYAHDLNYFYGSGPGNPVSAATGYPWVKAVSDIFAAGPNAPTKGGLVPPPLIMGFTHDNNLPPVVAALGLWNATLSPTTPDPSRSFRASHVVAFRSYVALERMSCTAEGTSTNDVFVRVRINRAPVAIPGCASGPGASCPLKAFLAHVEERGVASGDFVQKCALQDVKNATSVASFLTTIPDPADVQLVSL